MKSSTIYSSRGIWSRKVDIFLDVTVTLGIVLDWVPGFLAGETSIFMSGTKLIVVPLILFDLLRSNQKYVLNVFTWIYPMFFLIGVGGSWLLGRTSDSRIISLLPSILILMFYLKSRSPEESLRILGFTFYASLLVPLFIVLSWLGIVQPKDIIESAEYTRVLAAVSWSSLGLFTSIVPSFLGGILLSLGPEIRHGWRPWMTAIIALSIGLWGVILSGQRSAGLGYFIALGLALGLLFVRVSARQKSRLLVISIFMVIVFSGIFPLLAQDAAGSFVTRMSQLQRNGDATRTRMLERFIFDISTQPRLIGPGSGWTYSDLGIATMHIIFAEAYYDGGLLFMLILLFSFLWAGANLFIRLIDPRYRTVYYPTSAMLGMLIGSSIHLLTHPGLNIRLVYLVLGLCIANVNVEKPIENRSHLLDTELVERGRWKEAVKG